MANDFMKNINKMVLDGEVVSFNKTFPNVEVEDTVVEKEVEVVESKKTSKKGKKEETVKVEEKVEEPIVEEEVSDEPTVDEE